MAQFSISVTRSAGPIKCSVMERLLILTTPFSAFLLLGVNIQFASVCFPFCHRNLPVSYSWLGFAWTRKGNPRTKGAGALFRLIRKRLL